MAEKLSEVLTGGVVLVAGRRRSWSTAARLAGYGEGGASYPMSASFRSVEGVTVGTDVRMSGVKVGTVTGLTLNPQTFRADATLHPAGGGAAARRHVAADLVRGAAGRQLRRGPARRLAHQPGARQPRSKTPGRGQPDRPAGEVRRQRRIVGQVAGPRPIQRRIRRPTANERAARRAGLRASGACRGGRRRKRPATARARCCAAWTRFPGALTDMEIADGQTTPAGPARRCRSRIAAFPPATRPAMPLPMSPCAPMATRAGLFGLDDRVVAGAERARPSALRRLGAALHDLLRRRRAARRVRRSALRAQAPRPAGR